MLATNFFYIIFEFLYDTMVKYWYKSKSIMEYGMRLKQYCLDIMNNNEAVNVTTELGQRIMCPEYSVDHVDVKTFPLKEKEGIFVLWWNINEKGSLSATIKPYFQPFTYRCDFVPDVKTQYHTHDYIELAYIVEGEFKQRIMGKDILFKQGELCLIDKNCPHQDYLQSNNSVILFIGLSNDVFDQAMVENIEEEKLLDFLRMALMKQKDNHQFLHFKPKDQGNKQLESLLLLLLKELDLNDAAAKYICKGLIIRVLHNLSTRYDFSLSNEQRKRMNWLIYQEIIAYIEANYATITVKELVAKFHFNEDYYNRLLKDKLGMTYLEYVRDIRLKNALSLLKTTKLTIDEVADRVGYQNKGYFYKIFVEKYGATPAKFRK